MLQRLLRVDSAIASELNAMLLNRGVITTAGAQGTSMAVNPLNTNCVPNEAMRASNFVQKAQETKAKLDRISKAFEEKEEAVADEEPDQSDLPPEAPEEEV